MESRTIAGPIRLISADEKMATWGYKGENYATLIEINVTELMARWPEGVPVIAFKRADGREYAHDVDYMAGWEYAYVPLWKTDTARAGECSVTLSWIWNERVAKTETYHGLILESVSGEGSAPKEENTLLEQMNAAAARAEAAALRAEQAAERAEAAALKAQKAAGDIYETT